MPLDLIPYPQRCEAGDGVLCFGSAAPRIAASDDPGVREAITELGTLLTTTPYTGNSVQRPPAPTLELIIDPTIPHAQGYELNIIRSGGTLRAKTNTGLFYGMQTLIQIARQYGDIWPCLHIMDFPDYQRRGFYHDISRGKVPTLRTLLWMVKQLAALKINEFQLYIENVFQFARHPDIYADTTPLTAEDIAAIDAQCRRYHIDFVPSLASLGHFDKILRLPRYRHLAEIEPAELQRRGIATWSDNPWTLCVTDPQSKTLVAELYADFLPHFSSASFNICCDESWDLGLGRSAHAAKAQGLGGLYVDWVNFCANLARSYGKRIALWGDIIFNHPNFIDQLPADATLLEWGYADDHPFAAHGKLFAESRRQFYVCPGTSTWQSLGGRWDNAVANLRHAAHAGLQHGAAGFLNTDWGDYGHQQMLAISLLPMAYGAAVAWNARRDSPETLVAAAGLHIFGDRGGTVAPAICDMGNVYQRISRQRLPNASLDFKLLREPWDEVEFLNLANAEALTAEVQRITELGRHFKPAEGTLNLEQLLALQELSLTKDQILYTLNRTIERLHFHRGQASSSEPDTHATIELLQRIKDRYRVLWRQRNKLSRLQDISTIFDQRIVEHRQHMT
ncbi:MAG: glycoside hydrolase family 20 zincin-like fold domain-containing protein [Phycisphaerae bacterium]